MSLCVCCLCFCFVFGRRLGPPFRPCKNVLHPRLFLIFLFCRFPLIFQVLENLCLFSRCTMFKSFEMIALEFLLSLFTLGSNVLNCKGYYRETLGVDMGIMDILFQDNIVDTSIQSNEIACMRQCRRMTSQTCHNFGYNGRSDQCNLYKRLTNSWHTEGGDRMDVYCSGRYVE